MTEDSKHTPGPWHRNIPPVTHYNTVWAGRNTHVARVVVERLDPDEVEANIRLIAAAPDMLKALEAARHALVTTHNLRATDLTADQFDAHIANGIPCDCLEFMIDHVADLAVIDAAIAKATQP